MGAGAAGSAAGDGVGGSVGGAIDATGAIGAMGAMNTSGAPEVVPPSLAVVEVVAALSAVGVSPAGGTAAAAPRRATTLGLAIGFFGGILVERVDSVEKKVGVGIHSEGMGSFGKAEPHNLPGKNPTE